MSGSSGFMSQVGVQNLSSTDTKGEETNPHLDQLKIIFKKKKKKKIK